MNSNYWNSEYIINKVHLFALYKNRCHIFKSLFLSGIISLVHWLWNYLCRIFPINKSFGHMILGRQMRDIFFFGEIVCLLIRWMTYLLRGNKDFYATIITWFHTIFIIFLSMHGLKYFLFKIPRVDILPCVNTTII